MKNIVNISLILFVSEKTSAQSFVPSYIAPFARPVRHQTKLSEKADPQKDKSSIVSIENIDIKHAHDCADHFGKCTTADMEKMRDALHTERIKNTIAGSTGVNNPLGPEEELDRRFLEEDLSLQLSLLEGELSKQKEKVFPTDLYIDQTKKDSQTSTNSKIEAVKFDEVRSNPLSSVQAVAEEVEREFIIEPGLPEVAAVCGALMFIMMAPHIVGM